VERALACPAFHEIVTVRDIFHKQTVLCFKLTGCSKEKFI
jgi:hypothetical protein